MLRRYSLSVLLLGFVIEQVADARCIYYAPIRAQVTIDGCVGALFSSSRSQTDAFAPAAPLASLYKEGANYSGTVFLVTIRRSEFALPEDRQEGPIDGWIAGDRKSLFVRGLPDEVCPPKLPQVLSVTTATICCDMLPWDGACLVPSTVPVVTVTKAPIAAAP